MIRTDLLTTFVLIADSGSLNAAAVKLGLSRSVISERLTALEQDLGALLMTRSTRGLSLTPTGELFLEHCRTLLDAMEAARNAVADADGTLTGRIRIATPAALATEYLTPLFARFLEFNPRISLEVSASDRTVDIVQEGFDLAVRSSRFMSSDLIARKLTTGRRVVVCSPGYAERYGMPTTLANLNDHTAIIYRNRRITQEWVFPTEAGLKTVRLPSRFEADDGAVLRQATIQGLGLALMPTFMVARDILANRLIAVDVGSQPEADTIAAVYPRAHRAIPRIRALVEHLRSALGDPPIWDRELAAAGILLC